jgi:hypothetical protein
VALGLDLQSLINMSGDVAGVRRDRPPRRHEGGSGVARRALRRAARRRDVQGPARDRLSLPSVVPDAPPWRVSRTPPERAAPYRTPGTKVPPGLVPSSRIGLRRFWR